MRVNYLGNDQFDVLFENITPLPTRMVADFFPGAPVTGGVAGETIFVRSLVCTEEQFVRFTTARRDAEAVGSPAYQKIDDELLSFCVFAARAKCTVGSNSHQN
jgi:hypothetical protein